MLPEGIDGWQIAERFREDNSKRPVICAICFSPSRPRWRIETGFGDAKLIRKLGDVLEDDVSAL
ncbi:hypothetical protein E4K64_22520 [Bradyrhizobium frederickii]|uniref:Uncharacterized protein n=1 Tax=Bradyrhizobium frederickii TaxID=2560054 RepID=A0A4Y9NXD1_9BRAD|nr:hypothetical protein [Bradyrhizobium frederickii]TFV72661.1 hypothetical protein E4K64_22520 [Bradyrhizobium frederickii]